MGERQETKGLLLCTLRGQPWRPARRTAEGRGDGPPDGQMARKILEREMARLKRVLEDGLRVCDVYTRYSGNQYLGLLTGAGPEDAERILARLERGWQMAGERDMRLELTAEGMDDHSVEGAGDGEGDLCGACHQPGELHLAGTGHMAG